MRIEQLLEIIKEGESQSVEFKVDFTSEVGKTICALANTNDGTVLLGVSDDAQIKGVSEKIEAQVANVAHSCKPSVYPKITKVNHSGEVLLVVEIPPLAGRLALVQKHSL